MGAAAGGAAVAGVQQIVSSTIESTREIDRWANRLSVSESALRSWVELGREYGASVDDVTDALKELQLKAQDALTGGTAQAEMFQRVGISLNDLRPIVNDADALMALFTRRLNENVASGMQAFTVDELMSDAGTRMLPIFRLGTREIQRRREALTRAVGPTADLSRVIRDHGRRVLEVTRRWERFKRDLTARILPIIGQLAAKISEFEAPARRMIQTIIQIAQETNILKGLLIGVGVVSTVVAAMTITTWGPVVLAFIAVGAAVAGIAIAFDQVSRTIAGANTTLREYLDSEALLGRNGTEGLLLVLSDTWENMKRNISGATDAVIEFGETIQPVLSALQSVWEMISFISGGFGIADAIRGQVLPEGVLGGLRDLRGAAQGRLQERVAEERQRERSQQDRNAIRAGANPQNRQVAELERSDRWEGPNTDIVGLPMSVPSDTPSERPPRTDFLPGRWGVPEPLRARVQEIPRIPRSESVGETRIPRPDRAQPQNISIDAPMNLAIDIAEATDAEEVARVVRQEQTIAQNRWISELQSLISDQTEVGS